jgi:hypothetical protein
MRHKKHHNSHHQPKRHTRIRINWGVIVFLLTILALTIDWWLLIGRYADQPSYAVVFNAPTATPYITPTSTPSPGATPTPIPSNTPTPATLPPSVLINVPFQVQAPFANWDALHEETCEEASILMVQHYLTNTSFGTQTQADQALKDMVQYETDHGYGTSITVEQLVQLSQDYLHMSGARIVKNVTVDAIKQELAAGRPVIIPAAGRVLQQPGFKQPGPLYHMLVLKGYDESKQQFVSDDPGISKGDGFRYSYQNIMDSIHNWNGDQDILQGAKEYLVFN